MFPSYNRLYLFIVPALCLCCYACGPTIDNSTMDKEHLQLSLLCDSLIAMEEAPRFAIYAQLAESKIKIGEITACDTILPAQYVDYNIPDNAITALGGQWAGVGNYIYVARDSNRLEFFRGTMGELDSLGVQWHQMAVYEDGVIRAVSF